MVTNPKKLKSLLPYLSSADAGFYLNFPLISDQPEDSYRLRFPFNVVSESDPLSRLIYAETLTDAGNKLKRVFILVQRDGYLLTNNEIFPITNRDVDNYWQTTYSFYADEDNVGSPILLSNQISERNELLPMQSLFFCKVREAFFHPPCPKCSLTLQQCYDDDLLTGSGLQGYSTSLKRYLYCPACLDSQGSTEFYVYELGNSDPPIVMDCAGLITEFAQLLKKEEKDTHLPCFDCSKIDECYGSEKLVLSRVVPFSFYPFYMLISDAMSLHSLDFLSIVSGASFEELEGSLHSRGESGRVACLRAFKRDSADEPSFLFPGDPRSFLEVLYLKLTFLAGFVQAVFSASFLYKRPELCLSIDQFWIKLANPGGLLPTFWSFTINPIGIITKQPLLTSFPKLPPSFELHLLGLSWFRVLLANSQQDLSQVYESLGELFEHTHSHDMTPFEGGEAEKSGRVFGPENIFWYPSATTVGKSYEQFWGKALGLGWTLLRAGYNLARDWSKEQFWKQLKSLRQEVKTHLFQSLLVSTEEVGQSANRAIYEILANITHNWQDEFKEEKIEAAITDGLPSEPPMEEVVSSDLQVSDAVEEDIPETVVLTPEDSAREIARATSVPHTQELESKAKEPPSADIPPVTDDLPLDLQAKEEGDMTPETVMLSPEKAARNITTTPEIPPTEDIEPKTEEPPLPETMHLAQDLPLDLQTKDEEEIIPETIMLAPTGASGQPPESAPVIKTDEVDPNDDKSKTRKKKVKDPAEDDFVLETVFLSTDEAEDEDNNDE
jgi:hypothetical protein